MFHFMWSKGNWGPERLSNLPKVTHWSVIELELGLRFLDSQLSFLFFQIYFFIGRQGDKMKCFRDTCETPSTSYFLHQGEIPRSHLFHYTGAGYGALFLCVWWFVVIGLNPQPSAPLLYLGHGGERIRRRLQHIYLAFTCMLLPRIGDSMPSYSKMGWSGCCNVSLRVCVPVCVCVCMCVCMCECAWFAHLYMGSRNPE